MMKRGRTDGHISKETFSLSNDNEYIARIDSQRQQMGFARATPATLAARRIVVASRPAKKHQFATHINALNRQFYKWMKEQIESDASVDLTSGFQDYIDHVTEIEGRYLRSYGEVLTFGSGDCGQLAHGVDRDEDMMVRFPRIVYSLRDKKICSIACGGIHNAAITEGGQVFTWGCADDGSLGRTGDESTPLLVDALSNETVIAVACGDGQTLAVTTNGDVWGWGCYKDKEGKQWFNPDPQAVAPEKDIKKQQNSPIRIAGLSNVVDVACGASFNLAKCDDGVVYSWGLGECGELARFCAPMKIPSKEDPDDMVYDLPSILKYYLTPGRMYFAPTTTAAASGNSNSLMGVNLDRQLTAVENVKSIGCGAYHALLVVTGRGESALFACGLNNYGQLGLGEEDTVERAYCTAVSALDGEGVVAVRGGMHHSLTVTSTGILYAFGRSDSGQLGSSSASTATGEFKAVPVTPDLPPDTVVTAIDCGGNHNLALTSKNEVFSWGFGDMMALGHGDDSDQLLPKKLNFTKAKIRNISITQVAGGGQHSAIVGQVVSA